MNYYQGQMYQSGAPVSEIQRLENEILSLREELEEAKKTTQEKTTTRGTKQ